MPVLPDDDILTRVRAKAQDAVGWFDSRLSKERERVLNYYNGKLPARQHSGSSSYVSTDVYDSVEMAKAQLLEVFGGGDDIAQFDPDQDMAVEDCRIATEYARYIIYRDNDGFKIFGDVIHDGLTARVGVVQVYWDERYEYNDEEFEDLSYDDAMALAAQEDVEEFEAELDEDDGTFEGCLTRKVDKSRIVIENVPPEEFLIESRSIKIEKAGYVGRRRLMTKDELKKHLRSLGIDKAKIAKVDDLQYDENKGLDWSPEALARNQPIESAQPIDSSIQPEMDKLMLYESYARMVIDKAKGGRLYKLLHVDNLLFDYHEVDKTPFLSYCPLPVPHVFYGNNFAARVIPVQNARTVLTRAVLDHSAITVNPRWQVVKGGLMNPREMLDNRLGGIVNVTRPDSVLPLQYQSLNPFVFETLGMLKEDKEQSTGISSLSQGLNKDAISKQNAQGLVDNLVSLSTQRNKISARHFAYGFLVPLMVEVIRLAIVNQKDARVIEVAGKPLQVDPSAWSERTSCSVSMHLGYGEKAQAVGKHQMLYQSLAQDPILGQLFGPEQRHKLALDTAKLAGINAAAYLAPPETYKAPGPDPLKMKELEVKDKAAQAALIQAQAHAGKYQAQSVLDFEKVKIDHTNVALDAIAADRETARKERETAAKINIAEREMALEEQMRPQEAQLKAIVSPDV